MRIRRGRAGSPSVGYELATTPSGFTVVRPNEVFRHVDLMAREVYGTRPELSDALLAIGVQFLPPLAELSARHPRVRPVGYQLEQLYHGAESVDRTLLDWVESGTELWDYDLDNVAFLGELTGVRPLFRPLLYAKALRRVRNRRRPDVDVLFYGSRNARRERILDRIRAANPGRRLAWFHGWGRQLDAWIGRSKVVLNVHYYDAAIQEQTRLFYLLANGKCVISEGSVRNYYGELIFETTADALPDGVAHLLEDDRWRSYADAAAPAFEDWSSRRRAELGV